MDSLYNNTNFLPEGNRCNFEDLKIYGPFQCSYAEPTPEQQQQCYEVVLRLQNILLGEQCINHYCGKIFNYRIGKATSLVKNLYDFFFVILVKEVKFTYSPQFGINLWPGQLGYTRCPEAEELLHSHVSLVFGDYITETTTFLRYHIKFRYNHIFDNKFRKLFLQKTIASLLHFAISIGKLHTMQTSIVNALKLIQIDNLRHV